MRHAGWLGFFALVLGLTWCASACTTGQALAVTELVTDKVLCALRLQDLPPSEILIRCAIAPEDAERVLRIVGESKAQAAARAASAAAPLCPSDVDGGAR